MRFFITLEIPEEDKKQFESIQQKLHTIIPQVRLTDPDKLHLTFAFIGEQPDTLKQALIYVLQKAAFGITSFEITPAYIDGFPNIHYPKVFWTGINGELDKIIILRERIKDGLVKLNLDVDDRRFIPHITIAKLNEDLEITTIEEEKLQQLIQNAFTPIKVTSIKLFESIAGKGFHKHKALAEIRLN